MIQPAVSANWLPPSPGTGRWGPALLDDYISKACFLVLERDIPGLKKAHLKRTKIGFTRASFLKEMLQVKREARACSHMVAGTHRRFFWQSREFSGQYFKGSGSLP